MKKALLIKIEGSTYSSIGMETAFREAFDEVRSIDWQRIRFDGGSNGLERLWEEIARECKHFQPDLIFVQIQKSGILDAEQFKILSEYGFVINYTEDAREDISWYEGIAPHVGLTIFTNMDDCRKFWTKGLRAAYMMVSYNHIWYGPRPKTQRDYGDIVFIGNNYVGSPLNFPQAQERMDMCAFMKEKFGDRFQSYGLGMPNQMLQPPQVVEAYNNCNVVITHNHFKKEGYCSDRGLNAIGCGAVTIHHYFKGIEEMFKDAPDRFAWNDFNELEAICKAILHTKEYTTGYPFEKRYREATAFYTKGHHSWHNRCKFIKGFIKLHQHPDTPTPIIIRNEYGNRNSSVSATVRKK